MPSSPYLPKNLLKYQISPFHLFTFSLFYCTFAQNIYGFMETENDSIKNQPDGQVQYDDTNIVTLTGLEHIRLRPGMYIGKLDDGSKPDDGIYVLLKEVFDNSIDEFKMKAGDRIEVTIEDNLRVTVRDYGRGIPQGKLIDSVSILNTSGKFDSKAFKLHANYKELFLSENLQTDETIFSDAAPEAKQEISDMGKKMIAGHAVCFRPLLTVTMPSSSIAR